MASIQPIQGIFPASLGALSARIRDSGRADRLGGDIRPLGSLGTVKMPIGPLIRRSFGPFERPISELYRRVFIDLEEFARIIAGWVPDPLRILEIGCGEGAVAERLAKTFPAAAITAIDIIPAVGRLFRGDPVRVTFRQEEAGDLARRGQNSFDLIVMCDVLHHVPPPARRDLLCAAQRLITPQGAFVFKDWSPSATLIHRICDAADRYLTGDDVRYLAVDEAKALLNDIFGAGAVRQEKHVRPWANNFAFLVRSDGRK
jgi:2-polyprenyl-6-hydroxyphenyl methylase/3-demethylubiquinone-9 3-methyltransferase